MSSSHKIAMILNNYSYFKHEYIEGPKSLIKYIDTGKFFFIGHQKTIFNYVDVINVIDALKHTIKNNESKNQIFNLLPEKIDTI